jgi:hypothetical protein
MNHKGDNRIIPLGIRWIHDYITIYRHDRKFITKDLALIPSLLEISQPVHHIVIGILQITHATNGSSGIFGYTHQHGQLFTNSGVM